MGNKGVSTHAPCHKGSLCRLVLVVAACLVSARITYVQTPWIVSLGVFRMTAAASLYLVSFNNIIRHQTAMAKPVAMTAVMFFPNVMADDIDLEFDGEEEEELDSTTSGNMKRSAPVEEEPRHSERSPDQSSQATEKATPPKPEKGLSAPKQFQNLQTWEYLALSFVVAYIANFFHGLKKNKRIAKSWLNTFQPLLEKQFSVVGEKNVLIEEKKRRSPDEDVSETSDGSVLNDESYHSFSLYASGRKNVIGFRAKLTLRQRQDMLSYVTSLLYPQDDTITIEVPLSLNAKEPFVFAIVPSAQAKSIQEERGDLGSYCRFIPEGRLGGPIGRNAVLTDCQELVDDLLHEQARKVILNHSPQPKNQRRQENTSESKKQKNGEGNSASTSGLKNSKKPLFSMLHFTDDSAAAGFDSVSMSRNVLYFKFRLPSEDAMEDLQPLMEMAFHYIDLVASTKLSREARKHVEKLREKKPVTTEEDGQEKTQHQVWMENAQKRREKKLIEQQEKLASMSPKEAAKLEEKLHKKNSKFQTKVVRK